MKKKRRVISIIVSLVLLILPMQVYAASADVRFGSEGYNTASGEEFPVGLYIVSDSEIGTYQVELHYDYNRLDYVSGADRVDEKNGILFFEGQGSDTQVKMWLIFDAKSGGEAGLEVITANVTNSNGEVTEITSLASTSVYIDGEDTVSKQNIEQAEEGHEIDTAQEDTEKMQKAGSQKISEEMALESEKTEEKNNTVKNAPRKRMLIIVCVGGVLVLLVAIEALRLFVEIRRFKRRRKRLKKKVKVVPQKKRENKIVEKNLDSKLPVIKVENVIMKFKISTSDASGLKEYFIKKIKHQVSYRELLALDNICLDVYKGEVVGIIGTNGSGKSTLLKIISGALRPSSGRVIADKNKIQLLTLGTGFDGELTAHENVYLNGAIIGYSKEFIDQHYDEIVEFAELDGFMEEKVKNFSSGMVSRLGFAIATVGETAEILILDEVLSVGDEFFRKKSLERVKEMIHGGSTVLMVSHSTNTIIEHCTKAVWIEKGKMKMVGEPREVCNLYKQQKI